MPSVSVLGKKLKGEYSVALEETREALAMSHKERKLKFIFSFDSLSSRDLRAQEKKSVQSGAAVGREQSRLASSGYSESHGKAASQQKLGKRKRQNENGEKDLTKKKRKNNLLPLVSLSNASNGSNKEMVVSFDISGLETPCSSSVSSLLVSQLPVVMANTFPVSVSTSVNVPQSRTRGTETPTEEALFKGAPRSNSRRSMIPTALQRRSLHPEGGTGRAQLERVAAIQKLLPDPGSESGSEASGVNITSAILTPPSSCSEGGVEEEGGGGGGGRGELELAGSGKGQSGEGMGEKRNEETKPVVEDTWKKKKKEKVDTGPSFQDGVCNICDDSGTNLLACQGSCFQTFHLDCLGLVQPPSLQFVCDECQTESKQCFVCLKPDDSLQLCSKPKCRKFYHLSCIGGNSLFIFDSQKTKFMCPLHSCARCACNKLEDVGPPKGSSLVQCIKCPLALHRPHCLIAGCNLLTPTQMICYLHMRIEHDTKLYKHVNMDTCLECGSSGSLYCCDFCSAAYHRECLEEHQRPAEEREGQEGGGEVVVVVRGSGAGGVRGSAGGGEGVVRGSAEGGEGEGVVRGGGEVVARRGGEGGEKWTCPMCREHDLPTYGSVVLCKFGVWR